MRVRQSLQYVALGWRRGAHCLLALGALFLFFDLFKMLNVAYTGQIENFESGSQVIIFLLLLVFFASLWVELVGVFSIVA